MTAESDVSIPKRNKIKVQLRIFKFFKICRFVNDVLQKRLKEFTEIDKRVDVVNGSFPIKRTHREFIVVTVMHL